MKFSNKWSTSFNFAIVDEVDPPLIDERTPNNIWAYRR